MVVMIVRQQYRIDLGQGAEFDAGRGHAAWTGKSDGACAVRPDRIGKDVEASDLDQERCMADHGDTEPVHARFRRHGRSEEHTSELQSLMRISYAVFCLKKKNTQEQPIRTVYTPSKIDTATNSTTLH